MYVSPRRMANLLIAAFVIYLLVEAFYVASVWGEISLLTRIRDEGAWTLEEVEASDNRLEMAGLLSAGVFIGVAVMFLLWLYRIRTNEPHLGVMDARFSAGWSVWVWFIPIVWFFRPYQVVKEAWMASNPEASHNWMLGGVWSGLGYWWALWLVGSYGASLFTRLILSVETLDTYIAADWVRISSSVLLMICALLAIGFVGGVSSRQEAKRRNLQENTESQSDISDGQALASGK